MAAKVGVLGLQGDVEEHVEAWRRVLAGRGEVITVKSSEQLQGLDLISIPGGESTVIGGLADRTGVLGSLKEAILNGLPVLGTCAGMILLSKQSSDSVVRDKSQPLLGVLDVEVERNHFGRQPQSFEREIEVPALGREPYKAVFIRAPIVKKTGSGVQKLAETEEGVVAVRQGKLVGTSFHPELSPDARFYTYFLEDVCGIS